MDRQGSPLIQQPVKRQSINWWAMLIKPCLAEYVGTTLFVFAGILSASSSSDRGDFVNVALGHGLALFVMVACTAAVRSVFHTCILCLLDRLRKLNCVALIVRMRSYG